MEPFFTPIMIGVIIHALNRLVDKVMASHTSFDLRAESGPVWNDLSKKARKNVHTDPEIGRMQVQAVMVKAIKQHPGPLLLQGERYVTLGPRPGKYALSDQDKHAIAAATAPSHLLALTGFYHISSDDFVARVRNGFDQLVISSGNGKLTRPIHRRELLACQFSSLAQRLGAASPNLTVDALQRRIGLEAFHGLTVTIPGDTGAPTFAMTAYIDYPQLFGREMAKQFSVRPLDTWAGNVLPEIDAATVFLLCSTPRPGPRLLVAELDPLVPSPGLLILPVVSSVLPELNLKFHTVAD